MEAVILVSTYNGEQVILRQLESLRRQTVPVRVVIRDDCSLDGTVRVTEEYIRSNHLTNWQLRRNEVNLGWKRNFFEGMKECGGDIIFLCDQDDVWYPEKVEHMLRQMEKHEDVKLLSCDYRVTYEEGAVRAKIYQRKKEESGTPIARYLFTSRFFMNPRPGCSYAVRRSFLEDVQALWEEDFPHDEFLWLMAAMQNGAFFYNEVLMNYIRSGRTSSDIRYKDIEMQKENIRYIQRMLGKMDLYGSTHPELVPSEHSQQIRQACIWCDKRMKLMESRNPLFWLMMKPYWKYYNSVQNCLSDLYLTLFGSFKRKAI